MVDQDDLYYLQPGFDISTLTVPRIRSILVAHDVRYSSSAKKQELLDLLQQEVLPKSRRLLGAQARVKRTSRGITDVPSSQESLDEDEEEPDSQRMPPPPTPKTPRSRKSKSNLTNEDKVESTPRTARKSRTPSRRRSTKVRTSEDTESEIDRSTQSSRKTRKSTPGPTPVTQPTVKIEEPEYFRSRRSQTLDESPFSDDNPFQSGSSPPSESKRLSSGSRNRKSLGESKRRSTGGRRDTSSPEIEREEIDHRSSTYQVPVSRIGVDTNGVEATEEFTAEAGQELARDIASDRRLARTRDSVLTRRRRKPVSTATKTAPFAILASVLAALGGWYRQEKINIGYCGVGEPNWSLASNANIPPWVHENLQPKCEACPQHAICYSNMEVRCEDNFVVQPHPLSINGLIPLPPTCEPDSEKERRIKAVADRAVEELRERRALYECGDASKTAHVEQGAKTNTEPDGSTVSTEPTKLEIPEETLKQQVSKLRRKGMTAEEFDDLWRGALGDVINREEIEVIRDGSGRVLISSKSLANLPFTCAIRRSLLRAVSRNRIPIAVLIIVMISMAYARHKIVTYNQASAQIPSLVSMTLDRLATQAALQADGRVQESFISVGQLRDDVLRNVFSAQERERVWQRVRKVVEGNSNVRAATREGGKTGEWSRVWEWIGPVDFAPGLEGRNSGGMIQDISAREGDVRKWNEGHSVY